MNKFLNKNKVIFAMALLVFAFSYPTTQIEAQSSDKPKTQTKYKKARALQSKTAKKRTWCKKTPCAVDSDNKSCILDGKTNRCRARISKKALPKKKSSKIIKKTKFTK